MNVLNFYVGDEREICEEIRAWSAYALEKPNPYFNNLPPCPFAKKSWMDGGVSIIFKYGGTQAITSVISQFPDPLDLVIIVDQFYRRDADAFHDEIDLLNEQIAQNVFGDPDIWVAGFHPDDDAEDFIDDGDFEPRVNTPYAMIFVQRLTKVHEASVKLKELGYYEECDKEYDVESVFQTRLQRYRRLKNGDESPEKDGNGR